MRHRRRACALGALLLLVGALPARADDVADGGVSPAAIWLRSVQSDAALQAWLDETVEAQRSRDASLRGQTIRAALIDLPPDGTPRRADWRGRSPVYPASVPKFAYLMAAYAWRDAGRLDIDAELDRDLRQMVYASSNRATQRVLARLTQTRPGPRLDPEAYAEFRWKRHAVVRWMRELGVSDLHLVHPTYDGGGDLYGRDLQFLEDPDVPGSLPSTNGSYRNRQAMTALGTAELLALLATDRALSPESSAEVRERMRRDPRRQPYLWHRIAGGAARVSAALEVFAKTGTWGPIHADAGIVRHPSGHQLVVAVFLEGEPRYRGSFIAELTAGAVRRTLATGG